MPSTFTTISQFVDGTDFQRRFGHEQFSATVFGGAQSKRILRAPMSAGGPGGGCSATMTSLSHGHDRLWPVRFWSKFVFSVLAIFGQ